MSITWKNEKRTLRQLMPWQRNPRRINQAQAERLAESVEDFGQVETLAIGPQNQLYNGHQRLQVLAAEYGLDHEVDVRVADRPLTEKEREKLTIFLHKGAAGEWNMEALLAGFDTDDLLAWGFTPGELELEAIEIPAGEEQKEQKAKAECFVEIYCTNEDLAAIQDMLDEWSTARPTMTINIS